MNNHAEMKSPSKTSSKHKSSANAAGISGKEKSSKHSAPTGGKTGDESRPRSKNANEKK